MSLPAERPTDLSEATVIAPAYNEERALPTVLAALAPLVARGLEVIVVDDGSADRTSEVARDAGHRVIRLERNAGKAGAVRAGLAAVTRPKVILIDADGTYPVEAIPDFIRLLDDHDVVLGARTEGRAHIPSLNRFGNAALRTTIRWFSGFGSADPLTGLYGIRREHLEAMQLRSRGFGLEAEMGVKAARMGLRWTDYPITYAERIGESKLRPLRDGIVITWTVIRTLFGGPRTRPAQGRRDRLRPAPLAVAATVLSVALLTIAAILLGAVVALSLAALIDPGVALTTAITLPGSLALVVGVVLWRLATRWGRPGPRLLAPVALGGVAGGALTIGIGVLVADAAGVLPRTVLIENTQRALLVGSALGLLASPLAYLLALRAPRLRDEVEVAATSLATPGTGERLALAAILLLFAIPVFRYILTSPILGFDEAIYANTSRAWLLDTPNTGWSLHRSPGISFLGLPAVPFGSDVAFRLVGLLSGAFAVVVGWALARRLGGPAAGLIAAVVIATIPELVRNSGFFLTDVPSAAIVMLLMLVAWTQLEERPAPSGHLLWLAPIAAAAFYVRYGASVPILLVAVSMAVLWHRKLLAAWRLSLSTAGLLLLLLLPHLVQATLETGSPLGIARMAQSLAATGSPVRTLVTYVTLAPVDFAGIVGGLLIILGLAAWPVSIIRRSGMRGPTARALTFLLIPAVGQLLLLTLVAMAGIRYVLLPIMLLVIAGTVVAVRLSRRLIVPSRQALAATAVIVAVASGLGTAAVEVRGRAVHVPTQYDLVDAARAIRRDAGDDSCAVLGYPTPQITWYSGCATHHFGFPPVEGREAALRASRRYLILDAGENDRYPSGALRDEYRSVAEPEPLAVIDDRVTGMPALEIYRIPPDE